MGVERILSLDESVEEIIPGLMVSLAEIGLSVKRSFDLQSACAPHNSSCPHHGTVSCSCQLIVLMVYDWEGKQFGLIAHGSDGRSDLSICLEDQDSGKLFIDAILYAAALARASRT